jgi:sec-independent protein translocase protein TatB
MFPENRFMEVLIIGALALIVIGPKDLPMLMRRIGQFMGKVRGLAAEFRASFDELARQSELDELRREVEALRKGASLTGEHETDTATPGVFDEIKNNLNLSMTPAMTPLPQPEAVAPSAEASPPIPAPEPSPAVASSKPARKPRPKAESASAKPRAPRKSQAGASGPAS